VLYNQVANKKCVTNNPGVTPNVYKILIKQIEYVPRVKTNKIVC